MKAQSVAAMLIVLAPLSLVTTSCGPPKELTRDKALELLKAAPPGLLSDAVWDGALYEQNVSSNFKPDCKFSKMLDFSEHLASSGIITRNVVAYPRYDEYRPGGTIYSFQLANSTFAKSQSRGAGSDSISFVMGKARLVQITGIKQEGTGAVAEALITFDPTPIFEALSNTEVRFARNGPDQQCKELYSLPDSQSKSFRFERYDDGWRLKGEAE
jgi:hypothetical protein